jgi:hypothetical protein
VRAAVRVKINRQYYKWLELSCYQHSRRDGSSPIALVAQNGFPASYMMARPTAPCSRSSIKTLRRRGPVRAEDLEWHSPYATQHLKRFGQTRTALLL